MDTATFTDVWETFTSTPLPYLFILFGFALFVLGLGAKFYKIAILPEHHDNAQYAGIGSVLIGVALLFTLPSVATPAVTITATPTATTEAGVKAPPTPTRRDLALALPFNYVELLGNKEYDDAWEQLTDDFQSISDSKQDWINYFQTTTFSIDSAVSPAVSLSSDTALVIVTLTIEPPNGAAKTYANAKFCLIYSDDVGYQINHLYLRGENC